MPTNTWQFSAAKYFLAASMVIFFFSSTVSPQAPSPGPAPIPNPSQPPPAAPNAPPPAVAPNPAPTSGASPSAHMMRTWRQLTYSCDAGAKVVVNLHASAARVVFKGRTYNMKQVDDSDGQKYTDGSIVWRNKGEDGSLERASKSGQSKKLATGCHLQSTGIAPSASTAPATPK